MKRVRLFAAALAATMAVLPAAVMAADGASIYTRCAACHLPTGAGVPGAFPPLQADFLSLAGTPDGRRYLALVVHKGVSGPLVIDGKTYRNIMPAQSSLDDAEIAAVLNHVGTSVAKGGTGFRAFSEAEVAKTRQSAGALTSADVGALHSLPARK